MFQLNAKTTPKERENMKMKGEHGVKKEGMREGNRDWKILKFTIELYETVNY